MTDEKIINFPGPLTKKVEVGRPVVEAFNIFTAGMADWWPLRKHSISRDTAVSCGIEPRAGGELYETDADGKRHRWGLVKVWEPPDRLVFTWHPGRDQDSAQEVEVSFRPTADGTIVVLEHRAWYKLGDKADEIRKGYDQGWDFVLGKCFAESVTAG